MRSIVFHADGTVPRHWHVCAKERLSKLGYDVVLARSTRARGGERALETCERMDRILNGRRGAGLASRLDGEALNRLLGSACGEPPAGASMEVHGAGGDGGRRLLQILFEGVAGDEALYASLLERTSPRIEIVDMGGDRVLASGTASLDAARSLMSAADAVYARVVSLIEIALKVVQDEDLAHAGPSRSGRRRITPSQVVRQFRSGLAMKPIRAAYEAACFFPHWRVGWRFLNGRSVWDTQTLDGAPWSVLADPGDHFYADPFPIAWGGRRMIFFEDLDHATGKGVISAVDVGENGVTGPVLPVLEEPWHLSYPFLIEDRGELWMIPESSTCRTVDLYRAVSFPGRWVKEATLLSDIEASDVTIMRHDGLYWMFASVRDGAGSHSDSLCLYFSRELTGPWRAHERNPVLVDARSARPAGNVVQRGGKLWRPAQVCDRAYGAAVALCEVMRLDEGGFTQRVHHVLWPGAAWPGSRLHTLNEGFGLTCIDGWAASPRHPLLRRWTEPWCLRRGAH